MKHRVLWSNMVHIWMSLQSHSVPVLMHLVMCSCWCMFHLPLDGICDLHHLLQSVRLARGSSERPVPFYSTLNTIWRIVYSTQPSQVTPRVVKRWDKLLINVSYYLYHIPECVLNLKWLFINRMACISVFWFQEKKLLSKICSSSVLHVWKTLQKYSLYN